MVGYMGNAGNAWGMLVFILISMDLAFDEVSSGSGDVGCLVVSPISL